MNNSCKNLTDEIFKLIDSSKEGLYWDFKQNPHNNNAELLHDILAMANCLHDGNRYIIIGVKDPKENCEIVGSNQKTRKTQSDLIDFISTKNFAGDFPEVSLEIIQINNFEIDVIIIHNNPLKPYFLKRDFKDKGCIVKANYIYSRISDRNTPINESCDYSTIKEMWKEQFCLSLTPLEQMKLLLKKYNEWFKDFDNNIVYHRQFSNYKINFSEATEIRSETEPFNKFYENENAYIGEAEFIYESTILFKLTYLYVDGMHQMIAKPTRSSIDDSLWYYYFNLDTDDGLFQLFLTNGNENKNNRGFSPTPFIIFENEKQKNKFDKYLQEKIKSKETQLNEKKNPVNSKEYHIQISEFFEKFKVSAKEE